MPKILWATTFSADLWEHSGRALLESFAATRTPGTLVAYVEGMDLPSYPNVVPERIDAHPVLEAFRERHKAVIPRALGGELGPPECRCPGGPFDVHSKRHRLPCPGFWFCKNAFRWLRKPLAAQLACLAYGDAHDVMMWVDADASFLRTVPPEDVGRWFKGRYGCVYLKSRRTAIETGVFGYHMRLGGRKAAAAVLDRYTSGAFLKDGRWDDCVQMERGLKAAKVKARDMATDVGPNSTVIQFSPMKDYLGHSKGAHRRSGLIY